MAPRAALHAALARSLRATAQHHPRHAASAASVASWHPAAAARTTTATATAPQSRLMMSSRAKVKIAHLNWRHASTASIPSLTDNHQRGPFFSFAIALGLGLTVWGTSSVYSFVVQKPTLETQQDQPLSKHEKGTVGYGQKKTEDEPSQVSSSELSSESGSDPAVENQLFSRAQVAAHSSKADGAIWVTRGDGVYDITEFVDVHPGGERILLAGGTSIEPFWALFNIHNTESTISLLETYRIGTLYPLSEDPDPIPPPNKSADALAQLFANDPPRDPSLTIRSARPCNAEADPTLLLESGLITPNNLFFVRNHLPVPAIDPKTYTLTIENPHGPDFTLTLAELRSLPQTTVASTLQCAGNRRSEMHAVKPVKGLLWSQGAISTAEWTGPRLVDVLEYCRPGWVSELQEQKQQKHVVMDAVEGYGASIPLYKALDRRGDVVLALSMNGEDVPPDHGYPVRAIVPGHVAARSVKWLGKLRISDEESESHWQRKDYKGFGPSKSLEESDYDKSVSIQELPVQSAIVSPKEGEKVSIVRDSNNDNDRNEAIVVKGYAWSGGGRGIVRVDVSADGGKTWTDAQVLKKLDQEPGREWAWTHWEALVPVPISEDKSSGENNVSLVCKAVDTSYNEQPADMAYVYNVRGVLSSAYHRVQVQVANERD